MPNEITPASSLNVESTPESTESFGELLAQFEHTNSHRAEGGAKQIEATVVTVDADFVYLDIGFKTEGILARSAFSDNADGVTAGDKFSVSVKGRNPERSKRPLPRRQPSLGW